MMTTRWLKSSQGVRGTARPGGQRVGLCFGREEDSLVCLLGHATRGEFAGDEVRGEPFGKAHSLCLFRLVEIGLLLLEDLSTDR